MEELTKLLTQKEHKELRKTERYHSLLLNLMGIKLRTDLNVTGEIKRDGSVLIVANHLCIDDIPTMAQAVKKHTYLLVSDEDKGTFNGFILEKNGVRWINRLNSDSRKAAADKAVGYLSSGKNFAMYPEATWNLSPNLLMLKMNHGCVKIATKAMKKIQPVVSMFTDKERYTTIGEEFIPGKNSAESVEELRSKMASTVYNQLVNYYEKNKDQENIYETQILGEPYYYEKRADLDPYYWDNYVKKLYDAYPRAKKAPDEVREYESQFIFEPKTDDHAFFIIFNSSIRYDKNGNMTIKRISSEKDGYQGTTCDEIDYGRFFGYGYNECNYKKLLKTRENVSNNQDA